MTLRLPSRAEVSAAWVRRVVAATPEVTYFAPNSVSAAYATATGEAVELVEALYRDALRRGSLLGAQGDSLVEVAAELGVPQRGPSRALVLVILQPVTAVVTAITNGKLEVSAADGGLFTVGDSLRLTSNDGATHEVVDVLAKTTGTGPNGGTELDVGLVLNSYDLTGIVRVLVRRTKVAGTRFVSTSGVVFESLSDVTTGDSSPAMAGESTSLALADKVWAEAQTPGRAGMVEALTLSLQTPDSKIRAVLNPSRSFGGVDTEAPFDLKYRASHVGQLAAADTPALIEALAQRGNASVLRAVPDSSTVIGTLRTRVLTRSGGGLSSDAKRTLSAYIADHLRSQLQVEVVDMLLTAIEVEADVTLTPVAGQSTEQRLAAAWRRSADALATYLDYRKWAFGQAVDSADLLSIVNAAQGISTVTVSSFRPSALVPVGATSLPVLARLTLTDTVSGQTFGARLLPTYG